MKMVSFLALTLHVFEFANSSVKQAIKAARTSNTGAM
jgi:hypothetical protein